MKPLYVTAEMRKYQAMARKNYAGSKNDYIGVTFLGWNLHRGSVISYEKDGKNIEIEITSEEKDGILGIIANGTPGHTTRARIASIILSRDVTVYYSR